MPRTNHIRLNFGKGEAAFYLIELYPRNQRHTPSNGQAVVPTASASPAYKGESWCKPRNPEDWLVAAFVPPATC